MIKRCERATTPKKELSSKTPVDEYCPPWEELLGRGHYPKKLLLALGRTLDDGFTEKLLDEFVTVPLSAWIAEIWQKLLRVCCRDNSKKGKFSHKNSVGLIRGDVRQPFQALTLGFACVSLKG